MTTQIFGLENYFYHSSIRRYVSLFGSIFSDLYIKRNADDTDREDTIKVPIRYDKGHMYMKVAQDESREIHQVSRILPAMAFRLDNFYKDVSRKTNPMNKIQKPTYGADGTIKYQFNRIPYNFIFGLVIRTKNSDDMLQLVEQIIPVFDGNLSITIEDDTGVPVEQDIIISMQEISMEDNFDNEMQERLIEYTLIFELKGYLYKKTQSGYVIKEVDIYNSISLDDFSDLEVVNSDEISDKQILLSKMTDIIGTTPSTPEKKVVRRRKRK